MNNSLRELDPEVFEQYLTTMSKIAELCSEYANWRRRSGVTGKVLLRRHDQLINFLQGQAAAAEDMKIFETN